MKYTSIYTNNFRIDIKTYHHREHLVEIYDNSKFHKKICEARVSEKGRFMVKNERNNEICIDFVSPKTAMLYSKPVFFELYNISLCVTEAIKRKDFWKERIRRNKRKYYRKKNKRH